MQEEICMSFNTDMGSMPMDYIEDWTIQYIRVFFLQKYYTEV